MNDPRWCDLHKGPSGTALPIRSTEKPSSSPAVLYACAPCREQRGEPALRQWCGYHRDDDDTAVPIRVLPGVGYVVHACARCRTEHGLTPLAEQDSTAPP